ncbi:MAG: UvrD-helicase domain-containing protein [Pseudomonadota bacterium]
MRQLNPQQIAAVHHTDSPLLVIAGAGSGKTGVITHKIAHLINAAGIPEKNIFAVTFTNKAAQEMKQRVAGLLKWGNGTRSQLNISTFHTLGLRMLHRDCEHLGYRKGFTLMDTTDSMTVLKELRGDAGNADDDNAVRNQISRWKNDFVSPDSALKTAEDAQSAHAAKAYARYCELLHAYNAMDFDDLISLPVRLLREFDDIREAWQNRVRYLLVDEYQDTNAAQYALVQMLVGKVGNFTAVGDDDQSIYAWRGARPENLVQLQRDYPRLKVITLDQNYRSCSRILGSANTLIGNNPHIFEKKLWSDLGLGDKVRVMPVASAEDEADWVAADIATRAFRNRAKYGDYAILYRGNFQSRQFEKALREKQIPYQVSGGTSFFERAEVKDIMAYLRLLVNDRDDAAFLRVVNTPRREIGASTLEKLGHYARQRHTSLLNACHEIGLSQVVSSRAYGKLQDFANWITLIADNAERGANPLSIVSDLLDDVHYEAWLRDVSKDLRAAESRWANVLELRDWIGDLTSEQKGNADRSLSEVLSQMMLIDILENQEEQQQDAVNLLTLHASKGLEFTHVYLVGLEEDLLPHRTSIDEDTIEEERRLAYVGITRAQRTLSLSFARQRMKFGEQIDCEPSRFLDELPADDLLWLQGEKSDQSAEEKKEVSRDRLAELRDLLKAP